MKNLRAYFLATVSVAGLMATAAVAADMPYPVKAPVQAVAPVASWAGPYIGINMGAARHRSEFWDLGSDGPQYAFPRDRAFWTPSKTGFTIGGQAGYNWQTGNLVYGLEGDLNWVDGKASKSFTAFGFPLVATSTLDWMGTVRGRVGYAFSPLLVYATGGLAVAHISNSFAYTDPAALSAVGPSSNKVRTGWTAGGGIEYMFAPNWTVRMEGLYADFGETRTSVTPPFAFTYKARFTDSVGIVRGALNWKW